MDTNDRLHLGLLGCATAFLLIAIPLTLFSALAGAILVLGAFIILCVSCNR